MIEVVGLTKNFKLNKKHRRELGLDKNVKFISAVKDVNFKCEPGKIFTLLGPNGAGKTTVLRMIATMLKPSAGSIKVAGFDTVKEAGKVRENIGFLTGSTGLYARLTPLEVVKYYADLYGMDKGKFEDRKNELFETLGINEFAKQKIGKLSSGMKQKVSIARTMIHDPQVLIFDEPTQALDVITARNIIKLIRDSRDRGKTIIFSTHIMGEVSLLSDELAIIHKGTLLYNDSFENFKIQMKTNSVEDEFIKCIEEA